MTWSHLTFRLAAYLLALLLGINWITRALVSLDAPLFDLGTSDTGGVIIAIADIFDLTAAATFKLAHILAGLKMLLGLYLFAGIIVSLYELAVYRETDDALFEAMLFLAAIATGCAALAAVTGDTASLPLLIVELFVCLIAGALAALGRLRTPQIRRTGMPIESKPMSF